MHQWISELVESRKWVPTSKHATTATLQVSEWLKAVPLILKMIWRLRDQQDKTETTTTAN